MISGPTIHVRVRHRDALIAAGVCSLLADQSDLRVTGDAPDTFGPDGSSASFGPSEIVVTDHETGLRCLEGGRAARAAIVILTSVESETTVCRALQMGVRGYLLLNCSAAELIDALRRVSRGEVALSVSVASQVGRTMARRPLTQREIEILGQLLLGLSNKVIAARLHVSIGTVKTHIKSVLQKLDSRSRTAAVAVAHRRGIINVSGDGQVRSHVGPARMSDLASQAAGSRRPQSAGQRRSIEERLASLAVRSRKANSAVLTSRGRSCCT